jgi:hypothetical protein
VEHRRLGASGLKVSELSLGNWATHGAQIDENASRKVVAAALDCGITSFDTSDSYADKTGEEILGRALKGHQRHGLVISTKCFWPTGSGPNERGLSRKHILEACHASLARLDVEYVDVYYAHRFDAEVPLEETMRAFNDLVVQGKVLYIGVSEWTAGQIDEASRICEQNGYSPIIANQPQYSMLWRIIEQDVTPTCLTWGIGQVVWSPLAQGVLSGKYRPGSDAPRGSRASDSVGAEYISRWMGHDVLAAVAGLEPIAQSCGLTMAQLALAWVLSRPGVSSAIIGASSPEQVRANSGASGRALTPDVFDAVDEALDSVIRRTKQYE